MMLGARTGAWAKAGDEVPTVRDYIGFGTEDLLWMLDGINNTGADTHHDNSSAKWFDVCGSGKDIPMDSIDGWGWDDNGMKTSSQDIVGSCGGIFYYNNFFNDDNFFRGGITSQSVISFDRVFDTGSAAYNVISTSSESAFGSKWLNGAWGTSLGGGFMAWNHKEIQLDAIDTGIKYHITSSYDGSVVRSYLDGVLVHSESRPGLSIKCGGYLMFNYNPWNKAGGIDGKHYAHRLYGRVLTDDEIAANYAVDKARFNLQ